MNHQSLGSRDAADNARSHEVALGLLRKQIGPNHTAMLVPFRSAWPLIDFPAANREERVHLDSQRYVSRKDAGCHPR
jgi:hypothetical protein